MSNSREQLGHPGGVRGRPVRVVYEPSASWKWPSWILDGGFDVGLCARSAGPGNLWDRCKEQCGGVAREIDGRAVAASWRCVVWEVREDCGRGSRCSLGSRRVLARVWRRNTPKVKN